MVNKDYNNLVEIQEVLSEQNGMFTDEQKEALRENGVTENDIQNLISAYENKTLLKSSKENQFLQLLNKDSNWVTFFVKSIIQDSAKKGYEKVLFPSGKTVEKIEGFNKITEELERINNSIEKHKKLINDKQGENIGNDVAKLDELEKEKQHFLSTKKVTLSTINFYENTVANILKKQGYNSVEITDEYGNTWNEVTIDENRDNQNIVFQKTSQERLNQVQKLFESNPELANEVYEALGLETQIISQQAQSEQTKSINKGEETSFGSIQESKDIINTKKEISNLRDSNGEIPLDKIKEFNKLSKKLRFLQLSPVKQIERAVEDFVDKNNLTDRQKRYINTLTKIKDSFKEIVEELQKPTSVEFVKSEFMDIVDSNNESIRKIVNSGVENSNKIINDKSKVAANNLGIEINKEYSANELDDFVQKHGSKQVKFIWNLIKNVAEKLGVKTRFSLEGSTTVPTGYAGHYFQGKIDNRASLLQTPDDAARTIVHELIHGVTNYIINAVKNNESEVLKLLTKKQINAVEKLSNLLKQLQSDVNTKDYYGTKNEDEILAELTHDGFVEALQNKKLNFVEKLLDYILDILGIETNAYKEALQILEDLIENPILYIEKGFVNAGSLYSQQESNNSLSDFTPQKSQERLNQVQKLFDSNSEKSIIFAKLDESIKKVLLKRGFTESSWNNLSTKVKEHEINCLK